MPRTDPGADSSEGGWCRCSVSYRNGQHTGPNCRAAGECWVNSSRANSPCVRSPENRGLSPIPHLPALQHFVCFRTEASLADPRPEPRQHVCGARIPGLYICVWKAERTKGCLPTCYRVGKRPPSNVACRRLHRDRVVSKLVGVPRAQDLGTTWEGWP